MKMVMAQKQEWQSNRNSKAGNVPVYKSWDTPPFSQKGDLSFCRGS